ncbi:gliding motility-associated C-terminal domain-containing protein [Mucilaginibacter sp. OK098]|nr:gliding motility-associated C-terminal domain-containing protein [Mucilaginibacter sp. OK098]
MRTYRLFFLIYFGILFLIIPPGFALKNKETATRWNSLLVISNKVPDTIKAKKKNHPVVTSSVLKNNAACTFTATISGGKCTGSVLTVAGNQQPEKIEWKKDGITVETQTAGKFSNPVVVAGGHGAGSNANQLNGPDRLWIDAADNVYIPDYYNARVQKWAPGATAGVTVAGGNGPGNAANQLDHPSAVFTDAAGNIYIADQHNNRVQKWAPGAVTGETLITNLSAPTGIFVDNNGYIYVAEELGYVVKKYAPGSVNGIVVAGGHGQGSTAKQLDIPTGLFVDNAGNLFVSDENNNRIQEWSPGATTGVTAAGGHGAGNAANQLNYPVDICVDAFGNKYISDFSNNRVMEWDAGAITGTVLARNINASGITIAINNSLYVSDFAGNKVLKFTNPLNGTYTATSPGNYSAVVTSKTGCQVTTNAIEVIASETPQVTIAANTEIICDKFTPVFTAVPVNGGTSPLYQWQINGLNSGVNGTSATFSNAGAKPGDVITCLITSNYPCLTLPTATSNAITLTGPAEICAVNITADNTTICQSTAVSFTAVPTNGGTTPTYQWFVNDIASGTGVTYVSDKLNDGDRVTCIMMSDAAICQLNTTANSNVVVLKVNQVYAPFIAIKSNTDVYYKGRTVTFTAMPVDGGVSPVFQWLVNGANAGSNSLQYVTNSLAEGDVVTCMLTNNQPCTTQPTVTSSPIIVNITTVIEIVPPNTFTPNGDGINDTWEIKNIMAFPKCNVQIFSRYGQRVFQSTGYSKQWDGLYKGKELATGAYYYLIKLDEKHTLSGSVTILR